MVAGVPLDLKILHFNVIFDKIGSKIVTVVMTDGEGEGMYVNATTTTTTRWRRKRKQR